MGDHSYDDITSQFIKYDNNFHKLIFRIAGKESIWDMIFGINQHYERFRALVNLYGENNVQNLYKQHCTIVEALKILTLCKSILINIFMMVLEIVQM